MNDELVISPLGIGITEKKKTFVSLLLMPILLFTFSAWTCNVQSVVSQINSIIAEVAPAVQVIVALLPLLGAKNIPASVSQEVAAWAPKVEADVTKLGNVVQQYQSDIANNPTAQAAINAVVQTTENDVLGILPIFNVLDAATQQKVVALVTALGAAVMSIENIVNAVNGKVSVSRKSFVFVNGKDFRTKFNATLHAPTGDGVVDGATAQLSLK